jgi:hypothetical protein
MKYWLALFGVVLLMTALAVLLLRHFQTQRAEMSSSTQTVFEATPSQMAQNKIKQLAVAMYNYETDHGHLPPAASYSKDGKPLLSWRVLILPYLADKRDNDLYRVFKLDEPWDSPNNLPLLERIPRVYACQRETILRYGTPYQVFVGKGAAFEGTEGVSLKDFPDGLDKTILIVEAAETVPWTKPEDIEFSGDLRFPSLGNVSEHFFLAVFADGASRRFPKRFPESTLRALVSRNAGDDPGKDW